MQKLHGWDSGNKYTTTRLFLLRATGEVHTFQAEFNILSTVTSKKKTMVIIIIIIKLSFTPDLHLILRYNLQKFLAKHVFFNCEQKWKVNAYLTNKYVRYVLVICCSCLRCTTKCTEQLTEDFWISNDRLFQLSTRTKAKWMPQLKSANSK